MDSERLIHNKVTGFFISVADKIANLGATGICQNCGAAKKLMDFSRDVSVQELPGLYAI